jgi:DNA repair protein RecN (Recombination protein N)
MLLTLRISNFSVVEEAEVSFGPGLTALTGETGAGKSLLVDALGLLLGGRADGDGVRAGAEEASVEGLFACEGELQKRLEELGVPDLGDEVCLRRVIARSGRSRAYVNGTLVAVGALEKLMRGLVDVAGQHDQVGLLSGRRHLPLLDAFGAAEAQAVFRAAYTRFEEAERACRAVAEGEAQSKERRELLSFWLAELADLSPVVGEDVKLEVERRRLLGADRLCHATTQAGALLTQQDGSATELAGRVVQILYDAAKWDAGLGEWVEDLRVAVSSLEDAGRRLERYREGLEADPGRLVEIDERLEGLKRLCKKHQTDLAGLLEKAKSFGEERDRLQSREETLDVLSTERSRLEAVALAAARELSLVRARSAKGLAQRVEETLGRLGMPKARFSVALNARPAMGADGLEDGEFLFSANPGEPLRALGKVASGGEASRLLLALKHVLVEDGGRLYVMDEVDAGVSGATAEVVGRLLKEASRKRQVLCITHLPQVAAFADAHLRVEKSLSAARASSRVVPLETPARTEELARMLSGVKVTREALGAAGALLRAARPRSLPKGARVT